MKIVVTGSDGFLGRNIVKELEKQHHNVIEVSHDTFDLTVQEDVDTLMYSEPDIVIHAAAHVGGVKLNKLQPGDLYFQNALMGLMVMHGAFVHHVPKVVTIGTVCEYPETVSVNQVLYEDDLWTDLPEETNRYYAWAKKSLIIQGQAYKAHREFKHTHLLLTNLYGPGDRFDLHSGKFVASAIEKVLNCQQGQPLRFWGKPDATRDFLYVEDAAEMIVKLLDTDEEVVNVATGVSWELGEVVSIIQELANTSHAVIWNEEDFGGEYRRTISTEKLEALIGHTPMRSLAEGLAKTISYYKEVVCA